MRGFDAAHSYGYYEGTLRRLIHLFKYGRVRPLEGPLGRLLARAIPLEARFDAVAPMPLHWRRRWSRGFNQAELLARAVAKRCGVPLLAPLARVRATSSQAGLTHAARRANVAGAFRPRRRARLDGMHILLVDDVMTTGATAAACAAALKRAGARRVTLLTLARTDRRSVVPAGDASR